MEIIRAAHNLTIELGPTTWRLFNGVQDPNQPGVLATLVDARAGQITCSPAFARSRQLPAGGQLAPADVARVVVGWAPESQNWHLGLLLAAQPETGFKMRWCGLASWPRGDAGEHGPKARLVGKSLARIIDRPFHLIAPPRTPVSHISETQPLQPTTNMAPVTVDERPAAPTIPCQAPPFTFGEWALLRMPNGLIWQRRARWRLQVLARSIGFMLIAVGFLLLSFGTGSPQINALGFENLAQGMARVNPEWLPTFGVGIALLLFGLAAYNLWRFLTASDVIIDAIRREIRCQSWLAMRARWRVPFEAVDYLLVSQTSAQPQGREDKNAPMPTSQQVWLHVYDGHTFRELVALGEVEGRSHAWDTVRIRQRKEGRRALILSHYDTPAHHAAQVIAAATDSDVWLDVR
jgi:hypothetical protein